METGFDVTTETNPKPDIRPGAVANSAQKADIVTAPRTELDQWVTTVLVWEPAIEVAEEGLSHASPPPDDDEFPDPEEAYDSPGMEENIELGEGGAGRRSFEEEVSDDFYRFACERMEADWEEGHWAELTGLLARFDSGGISVSEVPAPYRDWIEDLMAEWGSRSDERDEAWIKDPDIVFSVRDGQLVYEVDLGLLEGVRLNQAAGTSGQARVPLRASEVPVSVIPNLIEWRRISLNILARYLIKKQRPFLLAPDLMAGLRVLRSYEQKDLAQYYVNVLGLTKKDGKAKKGEDWASRLLEGKYIRVPFQAEPFPARFFFDSKIEAVSILEKAAGYHKVKSGQKLSSTAMAVVLKALGGKDSKPRNIKKTYEKYLPSLIPGYDQLGATRITIPELTVLINAIGKETGRLEADLKEDAIAAIWEEKKEGKKKK